mmetsp:Transcript_85801/g.195594  ORF Transcript_85801/g.195594 Transcript_85801/m.195594 type:complete len:218 (-) Transcript_85801:1223-1876(-)
MLDQHRPPLPRVPHRQKIVHSRPLPQHAGVHSSGGRAPRWRGDVVGQRCVERLHHGASAVVGVPEIHSLPGHVEGIHVPLGHQLQALVVDGGPGLAKGMRIHHSGGKLRPHAHVAVLTDALLVRPSSSRHLPVQHADVIDGLDQFLRLRRVIMPHSHRPIHGTFAEVWGPVVPIPQGPVPLLKSRQKHVDVLVHLPLHLTQKGRIHRLSFVVENIHE